MRARAGLALEVSPLVAQVGAAAGTDAADEGDLPRAIDGDELARDVERLARQAQDDPRRLHGRQAEGLVDRHHDASPARRAEQACPGVPELCARHPEQRGEDELAREVDVDVRGDAVDGSAASPDVAERAGEEDRVRERNARRAVFGRPLRVQRLEGRALDRRGRRVRAAEGQRGPDDAGPKIEERLVPVRVDAPVDAHRLDCQRGLDAEGVGRLPAGAPVARVIEDAPVARSEAGGRHDLAGRELFALADVSHEDGEGGALRSVGGVAIAATEVAMVLDERARGDLDGPRLDPRWKPRRESAIELPLCVQDRSKRGRLRGRFGCTAVREQGGSERRRDDQIEGEQSEMRTRPEDLLASRALAHQGAVGVLEQKRDLELFAVARVRREPPVRARDVAEDRAHDAPEASGNLHVAEGACQRESERPSPRRPQQPREVGSRRLVAYCFVPLHVPL